MKRSVAETVLGAVVIIIAGLFLSYSLKSTNVNASNGYSVMADFSGIGGLAEGDDVQISGVKVGHVLNVELLPDTYLARVHIYIKNGYQLPTDTAALITSKSLLGGTLLALEPGADDEMIENGGRIEYTQAPQNLEQLLGQFIFSMQSDDEAK